MFEFVNKMHFNWGRNDYFIRSPVPEDSYLSLFNPQILLSFQNEHTDEDLNTDMEDKKMTNRTGLNVLNSSREEDEGDYVLIYAMLIQNRRKLGEKMKYLATHIFEGSYRIIIPNNPLINGVYNNSEIILTKLLICSTDCSDYERREQLLKYGRYHQIDNNTPAINLIMLLCYYMRKMQENSNFTLITYSNKPIKLFPLSDLSNKIYSYINNP